MEITKLQPFNLNSTASYTFANVTVANISVGNSILPTTSNTINIGSDTLQFGNLYLAGNVTTTRVITTTGVFWPMG